jgi:hypothetical protein
MTAADLEAQMLSSAAAAERQQQQQQQQQHNGLFALLQGGQRPPGAPAGQGGGPQHPQMPLPGMALPMGPGGGPPRQPGMRPPPPGMPMPPHMQAGMPPGQPLMMPVGWRLTPMGEMHVWGAQQLPKASALPGAQQHWCPGAWIGGGVPPSPFPPPFLPAPSGHDGHGPPAPPDDGGPRRHAHAHAARAAHGPPRSAGAPIRLWLAGGTAAHAAASGAPACPPTRLPACRPACLHDSCRQLPCAARPTLVPLPPCPCRPAHGRHAWHAARHDGCHAAHASAGRPHAAAFYRPGELPVLRRGAAVGWAVRPHNTCGYRKHCGGLPGAVSCFSACRLPSLSRAPAAVPCRWGPQSSPGRPCGQVAWWRPCPQVRRLTHHPCC